MPAAPTSSSSSRAARAPVFAECGGAQFRQCPDHRPYDDGSAGRRRRGRRAPAAAAADAASGGAGDARPVAAAGTGYSFDQAFQQDQIQAHQQGIALMQNYSTGGDVPALRDVAGQAIPVMQRHLAMAQSLVVNPASTAATAAASTAASAAFGRARLGAEIRKGSVATPGPFSFKLPGARRRLFRWSALLRCRGSGGRSSPC